MENKKWKEFRKQVDIIEKNGIIIHRDYLNDGFAKIRIYSERWKNPYRKFCFAWWKNFLYDLTHLFDFDNKCCVFDYCDIYCYLIINLTIKGLFFHKFSTLEKSRKQSVHQCWVLREKLLQSYFFEEKVDNGIRKQGVEKFGKMFTPFNNDEGADFYWKELKEQLSKEVENDIDCFSELGKYIKKLWD